MAKSAPAPKLDEDSAAVEMPEVPAATTPGIKPEQGGDAPAATTAVADEPTLELDTFCARLSETVRQVHAISAFDAEEREAGRLIDTDAAYQSRYNAMMLRPAR